MAPEHNPAVGEVRAIGVFPGSVHEAERCWYDTDRWAQWIDGLARVLEVTDGWPHQDSQVVWESVPAGRGRVRELVTRYEPLTGQTVAVEDDSITGTQSVAFEPVAGGVQVELRLDYAIKRRSPLTALIDRLFVRRLMALSLARTVNRFGAALGEG